MANLEERITRETAMLEKWSHLLKRKGFNAINSLLVANQIYIDQFVGETREGKPFFNLDAAELYAPVLEALPWQFLKDRYGQVLQPTDPEEQIVPCPRCKGRLSRIDIAYPNDTDAEGKPRTVKAWNCRSCNLVVEDWQLDEPVN